MTARKSRSKISERQDRNDRSERQDRPSQGDRQERNERHEAEKAYRDSLEIEPDHGGAKHEIGYIAKLRAGGQATGIQIMNGEESMKAK